MANKVGFKFGTYDEYAVSNKEGTSLFFTTDTLQLFKGDKEYSKPADIVETLPETGIKGKTYLRSTDGTFHVWDGTAYKQISYELATSVSSDAPSDTKIVTEKAVQTAVKEALETVEAGNVVWEPIVSE